MVLAIHDPIMAELREYIDNNQSKNKIKVEAGTIWPRSSIYHIDCTKENLDKFVQLAENAAECEMGIHLHIYQEKEVILEWYDAYSDPIEINRSVNEQLVREFSEKAGGTYERLE